MLGLFKNNKIKFSESLWLKQNIHLLIERIEELELVVRDNAFNFSGEIDYLTKNNKEFDERLLQDDRRIRKIESLELRMKVLEDEALKSETFLLTNQDISDDKICDLENRIAKVESLMNMPQESYTENKPNIKTTEAVEHFLNKSKKEFHLNEIFDNIRKYKLKNPNVTKETFKSAVYNMVGQGRIAYGKKPATFKAISSDHC